MMVNFIFLGFALAGFITAIIAMVLHIGSGDKVSLTQSLLYIIGGGLFQFSGFLLLVRHSDMVRSRFSTWTGSIFIIGLLSAAVGFIAKDSPAFAICLLISALCCGLIVVTYFIWTVQKPRPNLLDFFKLIFVGGLFTGLALTLTGLPGAGSVSSQIGGLALFAAIILFTVRKFNN